MIAKRKIYQLDENKNILAEFESLSTAAAALNGTPSKLSMVCKGQRCTALGYYWCYAEDYDSYIIKKPYEQPYNARPVVQLDPDTLTFIAEYSSMSEAEQANGVFTHKSSIIRSCKDPTHKKQALGYIWLYKEDYEYEKRKSKN